MFRGVPGCSGMFRNVLECSWFYRRPFKNPNWQREADQLAISKHDRGVELGSIEKQFKLSHVQFHQAVTCLQTIQN